MSKKTPETPQRKPRAKPKAAPVAQPVTATTAATEGKVEAVLATPKVMAEEILHQFRSGKVDSSAWAGQGYTVEGREGKLFVSKRVGCITKKLIDGEPLKLASPAATEPAEAPALAPVAPAAPAQQAQPNGNGEDEKKLPPPPPRRKTPPLGTQQAPAATEPTAAAAGTAETAQPTVSPAQPAEPNVIVPAMENPTTLIPAIVQAELNTPTNVTIFIDKINNLKKHINDLIGQADLLLRNGELSSGADILTIINNLEYREQEIASSERFYVSTLLPEERKLAQVEEALKTVRGLNGKIKEKLLALRNKQAENGEAERQTARQNKTLLTAGGVAAAIAVVLGGMVIAKKCTESEQPNATASAVTPDSNQTNIAPLPPEMPEQTLPPAPTPPAPPAKKTATFTCDLDTTDPNETRKFKCIKPDAPDADVTEDFAWAGKYNPEAKTVPAKVTLTTPDGKQFETTFDAQVGTRQQLIWTLEAAQ